MLITSRAKYFICIFYVLCCTLSCTKKSVELASVTDLYVEDAIDGSGQKVQSLAVKPGTEKSLYAIQRNADGSFVAALAVSWTISNEIATVTLLNDGQGAKIKTLLAGKAVISAVDNSLGNEVNLLVGTGPELSMTNTTTDSNSSSINVSGSCTVGLKISFSGSGNANHQSIDCSSGTYFTTISLTDGDGDKEIKATQTGLDGIETSISISFTKTSHSLHSWLFSDSGNYIFNSEFIKVESGVATLMPSNQSHTNFSQGTHLGTVADSSGLLILSETESQNNFIASEWVPKYSNLTGHWKLDNSSNDSGPNATHGIAQGGTTFSTSGKIGTHAAHLDGDGDYVDIASSIGNTNVDSGSVSFWLKREFSTIPATQRVSFRLFADANNFYQVACLDAGAFSFSGQRDSNVFSAATTGDCVDALPAETWVHVGASWSKIDNQAKLYINGKNISTAALPGNYNPPPTVSQIGSSVANQTWLGKVDEFAIFNTPLTAGDFITIYHRQKQKYSGIYTSPIIDLGQSGSWSSLTAKTALPFGKEVISSGSETATNYADIDASSLSTGLIALWKFNESSANSVPIGKDFQEFVNNNHANESGGVVFNFSSPNSGAALLDGTDDSISTISSTNIATPYNDDFTISLWVKPNWQQIDVDSTINTVFFRRGPATEYTALHLNNHTAGADSAKLTLSRFDGTNTPTVKTTSLLNENRYYHIAAVKQGANLRIYVDGKLENSATDTSSAVVNMSGNITFGNDDSTNFFSGHVDNSAIWTRAFTQSQIEQLYRRTANRIRYQFRSCDDPACDTEDWIGNNGAASYLSELDNSVASSLAVNLTSLPTSPTNNRYFQYRTLLEAEGNSSCSGSTTCLPRLDSLEIGPSGRIYSGNPSVKNATPISFSKLLQMQFTTDSNCTYTYQLSADGTTFYYWDGAGWSVSASDSQASSASDITTNLASFTPTGNLTIKSFIKSDGTQTCELDSIVVTYQ